MFAAFFSTDNIDTLGLCAHEVYNVHAKYSFDNS